MQARYYDPVIGRFYSNDPVGYTAANPVMSFNRYMYVNNNPYKYNDPDGQFLNVLIGGLVGAAIEAGTQLATSGEITDMGKIGVAGAAGALTGGLNIAKAGGSLLQKATAGAFNQSVEATAAAGGSMINDSLNGEVGSFSKAGEAALSSVVGPGKAVVGAVKGKAGAIKQAMGKTDVSGSAKDSLTSTINSTGEKIASGVAANKINEELKDK
ncbi:RHS repeat-associated core domain-containing protein [Colwellia chukchiensis]|uniref:RHS repeat-associated core domain-containing protein n=1 Tax=Colwellia chukchiensis TaxID=641665 RepID=A0A1H7UHM0_9GAMM|nr:RHS repeat-associated core domain-containing protein [Colwellia chukchiensis]SEL96533.1 RHS repeat-associated core domain-containing protein [Colwellia chukchiensis]